MPAVQVPPTGSAAEGSKKGRHFPFTLNNYSEDDFAALCALEDPDERKSAGVRYIIFAKEVAPTTGTPHLQGYVYLENARVLRNVHRVPGLAHAAIFAMAANSSPEANRKYVMKTREVDSVPNGEVFEFGEFPSQGKRTDLGGVVGAFKKSGYSMAAVAEEFPEEFLKYHRGLQVMASVLDNRKRDWMTKVIWLHGPTGSGKSRAAHECASPDDVYWKPMDHQWWDGYRGQPIVVMDDYRKDFCTFSYLLRLFDRYPLQVNIKGSTTQFLARYIIVTCPLKHDDLWTLETRTEGDLAQLTRRIAWSLQTPFNPMDQAITWPAIVREMTECLDSLKPPALPSPRSANASPAPSPAGTRVRSRLVSPLGSIAGSQDWGSDFLSEFDDAALSQVFQSETPVVSKRPKACSSVAQEEDQFEMAYV